MKQMSKSSFRSPGEYVVLKVAESTGPIVSAAADVADYLRADAQSSREWFRVLYLNVKNAVILNKLEFIGTVDSSAVYPREVIVSALGCGASCIVLAHNHPSGDPSPSLCDKEITKAIVFAAATMSIKVLDHVIIGAGAKGAHYSMADQGEIDSYTMSAASYASASLGR